MVDKELIEQAKDKIGDATADIIADIFKLEKYDSKNKKGCCPFHFENTPSFIYSSKTHRFHCFGKCNKSVDIVDAFIEGQGMTFNQAVSKVFELADMDGNDRLTTADVSQVKYAQLRKLTFEW